MSNHDIIMLKRNIKRILDEKGITQTELAEKLGTYQGRISKILDEKKSDCFTVAQLVDIKEILGCTMEELFFSEKPKENEITTPYEALEALFKLGNYLNPTIQNHYIHPNQDVLSIILFPDMLQKILYEWKQLLETTLDESFKKEMLENWQKTTLEKHKNCTKENFFTSSIDTEYKDDQILPFI